MCYKQSMNGCVTNSHFNEWMCYSVESIYVINIGSKLKEGGGGGGKLLKRSAAILNTYIMAFEKAE